MPATADTPPASHPLYGERLLTLLDVCKRFPGRRGAGRMHYTSVLRRIVKGTTNHRTGEVVKLEAFREGGRWLTSEEALARYHAGLARTEPVAQADAPKAKVKSRGQAKVLKELEAVGI